MDVTPQLKDAVGFFALLFGDKTAGIEELLEDDNLIAEYNGENTPCGITHYAGQNAGLYFVCRHNNDQFEKDADMGSLLMLTGRAYAAQVYHAEKCGCTARIPVRHANMKQILEEFTALIEDSKDKTEKLFFRTMALLDLCEIFGSLLHRHYGSSKLADYSKMNANQAMHFIEQTADLELKRN